MPTESVMCLDWHHSLFLRSVLSFQESVIELVIIYNKQIQRIAVPHFPGLLVWGATNNCLIYHMGFCHFQFFQFSDM